MTNEEKDLFVKACTLLTVATFFSDKNRKESVFLVEQMEKQIMAHTFEVAKSNYAETH
jgi:hypothetical protein